MSVTGNAAGPAPILRVALTEGVELHVERRPFRMALLLRGRRVLATSRSGAVVAIRGKEETGSRSLRSWRPCPVDGGGRGVELIVCMGAAPDVRIRVIPSPSMVAVSIRCPADGTSVPVGISFEAPRREAWFGGEVLAASQWPLNTRRIRRDPFLPTGNQTAPLWLSSRGAAVFAQDHRPIGFSFNDTARGSFRIVGRGSSGLDLGVCAAEDIRRAHRAALCALGVPRQAPPVEYFSKPVFSTWIEFLTRVDEAGVLRYTESMERTGFPCSVLVIDDKWTRHYGDLSFDPAKFPDPRRMVEAVHSRGIRTILWVTPFIDPCSDRFTEARDKGYLLRKPGTSEPFLGAWWNGRSALIDFSHPGARRWFLDGLRALVRGTGVDGFKLDAGDAEILLPGYDSFAPMTPWDYTDAFASVGAEFPFNELRVSWLTQRLGLVQRLRDKSPTWSREDGLGSIIPHGLCEGLLGYPYFCADMIGGGWDAGFRGGAPMDEELFVRWTQASALLPIMQFSYAPWRLSAAAAGICRRYVRLHEQMSGFICDLARQAARDGSPIVKPLFFDFPADLASYRVSDQFLLGSRFLVAPVLRRGARRRHVYLPPGAWKDYWSGAVLTGPRLVRGYPADLETLPVFERAGWPAG